jgi:outer membrane protein OmpA-like peptidoglycan-associated protein
MFKRTGLRSLLPGLLLFGAAGMAVAADPTELHRAEFGVQGGFFLPDQDISNKDSSLQEIEPTLGARFALRFARHFDWFVDAAFTDVNSDYVDPVDGPIGDVETKVGRTGIDFYFQPHGRKVQWFLTGGGGIVDADLEEGEDFDRNFASVGFGQRVRLDSRANFRWEFRGDRAFDDSDILDGEDIDRYYFLISVNWGLGGTRRDSDGDGVRDRDDDCPDTPRGATVDERGCPSDSDGDGVWDGIDRCPDTPRGAIVDEWGCPKDSDGDGVWDGIDRCPDTPRGAIVDEWGCPKDSDGDGVWDGIDRCPDTPRGAIVDEWGCPKDSDGDGVWDGIDKCPDTPRGTPVRPDGCPKEAPLFTDDKKTLILEGVFFEFDKAVLKPVSRETLDRVARSLADWPEVRVEVGGHTDGIGTDEYNEDLSFRRAGAVKDYLATHGVAADRMTVRGYGESQPIADNRTSAGRAKNRRVVLTKLD